MVGGLVQGTRTYDPTSGQWVTPDAYAGDVHDPMSQKPFMWNNNNPVQWSDPSGYEGCEPGTCGINPINPPTLRAGTDVYAKAEGSAGIGTLNVHASISVTSAPGLFFGFGGSTGFSKTSVKLGRVGFGGSVTAGFVTASPGHTTSQVMTQGSAGFSAGYYGGIEHYSNNAGSINGAGAMTPQIGGGGGWGIQLLGVPGASDRRKPNEAPKRHAQQTP